ncbi:MAG: hypothetical protein QXG70_03620 [Candidatus Methanomethylicaceae archaeon]
MYKKRIIEVIKGKNGAIKNPVLYPYLSIKAPNKIGPSKFPISIPIVYILDKKPLLLGGA